MCVCVCVCACAQSCLSETRTPVQILTMLHSNVCVCVCVCVQSCLSETRTPEKMQKEAFNSYQDIKSEARNK